MPDKILSFNSANRLKRTAADINELTGFTILSITNPNATVVGGYRQLSEQREIATYSGSGSTSATFGSNANLTVSLTTALGASPAATTNYYLYIDLATLSADSAITQTDTGRKVFPVTATSFKVLTTLPENVNRGRYLALASIRTVGATWTAAVVTPYSIRSHDTAPATISPVVYRLSRREVGDVGTAGQSAAGHNFASTSFSSALSAANISWWNFAGSITDGSANARDFTNTNATPLTGQTIFGGSNAPSFTTASSQDLRSTAALFNPGDTDFACGGWFRLPDWTPATTMSLFGQWRFDVSERSFQVRVETTGSISIFSSTDGSAQTSTTYTPSFVDNTWHFFALRYTASSNTFDLFVDGSLEITHVAAGNLFPATSGNRRFTIGSNGSGFLTGQVGPYFFLSGSATTLDLRKLYTTRIDHNTNTLSESQDWSGSLYRTATAGPLADGWIFNKSDTNALFADFSNYLPTEQIELTLKDDGISGTAVSVKRYDSGYFSASPTSPVTHQLSDIPTNYTFLYEVATNEFEPQNTQGIFSATSSQLIFDLSSYTFSASNRGRIIATCGDSAVVVPNSPSVVTKNTLDALTYTVQPGNTAWHPQLDIPSGQTYNVSSGGTLVAAGGVTGAGTLSGDGTIVDSLVKSPVLDQPNTFTNTNGFAGIMLNSGSVLTRYVEGVWTPTISTLTNLTGTAVVSVGKYEILNNKVSFSFRVLGLSVTAATTVTNFQFTYPVNQTNGTDMVFGTATVLYPSTAQSSSLFDATGNVTSGVVYFQSIATGSTDFQVMGLYYL